MNQTPVRKTNATTRTQRFALSLTTLCLMGGLAVAADAQAPKPQAKPASQYANTLDKMWEMLPRWSQIADTKPATRETKLKGQDKPMTVKDEKGQKFQKVVKRYSLADTPKEFMAMTTSSAFWPGSLVQARDLSLGVGAMRELPVSPDQRAPFKVTIPDYGKSKLITRPSSTTVSAAIADMMLDINKEIKSGKRGLQVSASFEQVETTDEKQTSIALGLGARFAGASLDTMLGSKKSVGLNTVTGCYIERAFKVQADFEGRTRTAAFFSPSFTIQDAAKLQKEGNLYLNNPPAFIESITYGRIIMLRVTARRSASEIKAALSAAYGGKKAGGEMNLDFAKMASESSTEIRAAVWGGDENTMKDLIEAGNLTGALKSVPSITTMKPISYLTYAARDKTELATARMTTDYSQITYEPIGGGQFSVRIYAKVVGATDFGGGSRNTQDVYGSLLLNGKTQWKRDMGKRGKGTLAAHRGDIIPMVGEDAPIGAADKEKLDPGVYTVEWVEGISVPIALSGRLMEWDNGGKRDDTMGLWETKLDIGKLSLLQQPVMLKNSVSSKLKKQERAELYIYIERK